MTVDTFDTRQDYTGNGVATFFEFDFPVLNDPVGVVVYVDSILVTNYSVQSNGINFDTPPADGSHILIVLGTSGEGNMELNQLRNWEHFDRFPAEKTEDAADKLIVLKGGAATYGRFMNLSVLQTIGDVTLVNDKGADAVTPLWEHTLEEAGMFSATVADQIPLDGSPTNTPESHVWISFPDSAPPADEPTAPLVDSSIPAGQVMTELNFSSFGDTPQTARSHPLGGNLNVRDFTAFFCFRWTSTSTTGPIWDSEMFEITAARRPTVVPEQYFVGWNLYDANVLPRSIIQGNTLELGNLQDAGGLADIGDWVVWMMSMKNIHVPDPDRFQQWFVNLTRGSESDHNVDNANPAIGDWDSAQAGDFGMQINTPRSLASRMGFLNNRSGDVTGAFGFSGTMGPHAFHFGTALDFSMPSERRKICSLNELTNHGIGGVNIFGEKATYYSQGDPQLNTGWINTGDPSVFNQAMFGTGANLPPYDYPVTLHSMGDWEYDNMADAEASGDTWLEGQTIFIDEGNQVMVYRSALVVDGHSGLIHLNPFFTDNDTYTGAAVIESQPEGADPDTWGWTDSSIGTKGVDYDFDVSGGRARLFKITAAGQPVLFDPTTLVAGDEVTFGIFDKCTAVNPDGDGGCNISLRSYGVANRNFGQISAYDSGFVPKPPFTTWALQHTDGSTYENILELWTDEIRFWFYVKDTRLAVWSDVGPLVCMTAPRLAGDTVMSSMVAGFPGNATLSELLVGRFLLGRLT